MKINAKKRFLSWIIAFLMVFAYVPAMAYATDTGSTSSDTGIAVAAAGDITVLDGQIKVVDSRESISAEGDVVTAKSAGASAGALRANNINLINNTDKIIVLTVSYDASNCSAFSEGMNSLKGTKTLLLNPGDSMDFSITGRRAGGDNTAVLILDDFKIETVEEVSEIEFTYDDELGSITVGGDTVVPGDKKSIVYKEGVLLEAHPNEGVDFLGWINHETGKIYTRELTYTFNPTKNGVVEAVFSSEDTAGYYLIGEEYLLDEFDAAMSTAENVKNKVVVLLKDTVLSDGAYTVPEGVTLLVPFDDKHTLYNDTDVPLGLYGNYQKPNPYCTLTLGENAKLEIDGAVSLSAIHFAARGGGRSSGAPTGDVSFVDMKKGSSITVNSGGALYAYGFVVGEGTVNVEKGGTVYELFQIENFRGGNASVYLAKDNAWAGVLPISQYYVQNIEVPMTIEAGAKEFVYTSVHVASDLNAPGEGAAVPFIGTAEDGAMFRLSEGSIVKAYDGTTDRLVVEADGMMKLAPISVTLQGTTLPSEKYELPINSNITVKINSGEVELIQDIALLPGSEIMIDENAECSLDKGISLYVYDSDQWGAFCENGGDLFRPVTYAPGRKYDRTIDDLKDASVLVNGILDASKGAVYSTVENENDSDCGGKIYSSKNGIVKIISGNQKETYQFEQEGTAGEFVSINIVPAKLLNGNGEYLQTIDPEAGMYTYDNGQWVCSHASMSEKILEKATCIETGLKEVTCVMAEKGDGHTRTEVIPLQPHTEVIDEAKAPTCTETGLTEGKHCDVCSTTLVEQETVEALNHNWGDEYIYDKEPTCTEQGSGTIHCERCSVEKEDSEQYIEPLGHSYEWKLIEPTCTTIGTKTGVCTRMGCLHSVYVETPALNHDYETVVTEPTCTEGGYTTHTCNRCDSSYVDSHVDALEHKEVPAEALEPTCTEDGHAAGTYCERCNLTLSGMKPVKSDGHKYGEWVTDPEPTCTEKGERTRKCLNCDDSVETEHVDATGHTEVIDEAVPATCTEDGKTEGVHCSECHVVLVEQEVIPASHKFKETVVEPTCTEDGYTLKTCECGHEEKIPGEEAPGHVTDKFDAQKPTCTEIGWEAYEKCKNCDYTTYEELAATGHAFKETVVGPTCTEDGYTLKVCDCGYDETVAGEKAPGHDIEFKNGKEPTCTEIGWDPYEECSVCDYTTYEELAAVGHSFKDEEIAATCTEDGYTIRHCKCGHDEIVEGEKAIGHSFTEYHETTHATCIDQGRQKAFCDNKCGAVDVNETGFADHTPETDAAVDATCTETGLTEGSHCSVCDKVLVEQTETAVLGHDCEQFEAVAATCTEPGHEAYEKCKVCDYTTYKETEAAGHTPETDAAVDATCTEKGLTEGSHCDVCGEILVAQEVIDLEEHAYGKEAYKNPTSKTDGGYYVKCADCGHVKWTKTETYAQYMKAKVNGITIKLTAVGSQKTENISVEWKPSANVSYYKVQRAESKSGKYTTLTSKITSKAYVDKTAKVGKTYYYKVTGYKTVGKSVYSTKVSNIDAGLIKKATAAQIKETKMSATSTYGPKSIIIKWTSPKIKVDGYQVYRSKTKNGTYKKIATTSKMTYTDKKGKVGERYYYKVRGYKKVNGKTVYTKWSKKGYRYVLNTKNGKLAKAIEGADAIKAKKAVKASKGIKITWTKDKNVKTNKYKVYRATSKNGKYEMIGYSSKLNYTDKLAKKGKTYYYKVKGYRYFGKACPTTEYSNAVAGKR